MESDGDHFLAYYLTKEDDAAVQFKVERLARDPTAPEEEDVCIPKTLVFIQRLITVFRFLAYKLPLRKRLRSRESRAGSAKRVPASD